MIQIHCAHDAEVSLADLKPHPQNPNTHPDSQIALLAKIIKAQGWRNPIVVSNRSGLITKGHGRLAAALTLGATHAPVDYQDYASEKEELADMIADNRIAELAEADRSMLRELAEQLDDGAFDMDLTGFDHDALEELMTAAPPESDIDAEPQIDKAEELRVKWGVERGQVWELGEHRIMCGDCRYSSDVDLLLRGTVNVAFTSPPYASQRDYDWFNEVQLNVHRCLVDDGSWFVNIKPSCNGLDTDLYVLDLVSAHARRWKWHFVTEFCWERSGIPKQVIRRFKNQFEPVYQFTKGDFKMRPDAVRHYSESVPIARGNGAGNTSWAKHQGRESIFMTGHQGETGFKWFGDNIEKGMAYPGNRLPTFAGSHSALGHAAAFPIGLPTFFLNAFSDKGDRAYDPFLGSGSTLMACENTKRIGFGMELSANYVAVSIQRWADATGKTPKLLTSFPNKGKDAKKRKSTIK